MAVELETIAAGIVAGGLEEVTVNGVTYAGSSYDTVSSALKSNAVVAVQGGTHDRVAANAKTVAAKDAAFSGGTNVQNTGGAISVSSGGNFIGENVVITGSTASTNGGGIYATGNVTLVGSTVSKNIALGTGAGGGIRIHNASAVLSVSDTVFENNSSPNGCGGAVYVSNGSGTISNTIFRNNDAKNGGAIYNAGTLLLDGVSFSGNTATNSGSAIYNSGTMIIKDSTFGDGQSIYSNKAATTFTGTVTIGTAAIGGSGFIVSDVNFVFTNTDVLDWQKAAFAVENSGIKSIVFKGAEVQFSSLDLSSSVITIADGEVGTFASGVVLGETQTVAYGDASVTVNKGGLTADKSQVVLVSYASNTLSAVLADTITIDGIGGAFDTFASISAAGFAYTGYTGSYTVTGETALSGEVNNEIINNSTITVDGLLTLGTGSIAGGDIVIDGSKFSAGDTVIANYDASKITGNILIDGDFYGYIDGSDLKLGEAVSAAIMANGKTLVTVGDVVYSGTAYKTFFSAYNSSGADVVVVQDENLTSLPINVADKTVVLDDIIVSGSTANGAAVNVSAAGNTVTMTGSTVSNNTAGAGMIYTNKASVINIKDTVIESNTATGSGGGAIYISGSSTIKPELNLDGVTVRNNDSTRGAVYIYQGQANIANSVFESNEATGSSAGAIFIQGTSYKTTISNTLFKNNSSVGDSAAIENRGVLEIIGGTFTGNTADKNAGAVYAYGGTTTIRNSYFYDNTAVNGGAIFNNSTLELENVTFAGNTCSNAGTAVYSNGTMTVNGAVFGEKQTIYSNSGAVTLKGTIYLGGNLSGSSNGVYQYAGVNFVFTNAADISIKAFTEVGSGLLSVAFNNSGIVNFESADLSDVAVTIDGNASGTIATGVAMGADQKVVFGGNTVSINDGFVGNDTDTVSAITCVDGTLAFSTASTITIDSVGGAFDRFSSISAAESAYTGYTGSYTVTDEIALSGTVNNEIINNSTITVDGLLTLGSGSIAGGNIVIDGSKFSVGDTVIANYDASKITGNISVDGAFYTYTDGSDLKVGQAVAAGIVANGATAAVIGGVHYAGTAYSTISASLNANAVTAVVGGTHSRINTAKTVAAKDITISTGSTTTFNGGALNLSDNAVFFGENIVLSGNTVTGSGGGIYLTGDITLTGSTVSDNTAGSGGGMRVNNAGAVFNISDSIFSGNIATASNATGGAITINSGSGTITDTIFTNNTAVNGGAIYNAGTLVLEGVSFNGNTATTGSGNAIYNAGTMTVKDAVFAAGQTVYSNNKPLTFAGTITIGDSIGGNGFGFDNASLIFTNTETIDWRKNQYTIVNDGIVSIKFNGNEVRFGNATGATSYLDLSATAITIDCALPADDVTLTIASGITLADGQAITVNGIAVTVGTAFTVDDSNYLAAYTANALTLSKIPAENADITGTVTGLDTIASSTNYKGKVFGGETVTGGTVTTASAVTANAGDSNVNALFGGSNINADSTAIVAADSSVNVSGIESANFVFGGHYVAGGTVALTGNTEVTISDGTFNRFVGGGNIVNTGATMRITGDSTLNISGGVFNEVVAGGSNSQGGKITYRGATITTNISGGTFNKRVFGGNIASKQVYATKNAASVTLIDIENNSDINLNIDSGSNDIYFGSDIVAGSYTNGKVIGTTTVTFTGLGENLDFTGVLTGDSTSAGEANKYVTGTRTLVFDDFDGDFSASGIVAFDDVKFINGSEMTFTTTDLRLSPVRNWTFELGSTLNWEMGTNSFFGDTLTIDFGGASLDSNWTIINGCETTLTYWDNGFALNGVVINGETAAWDSALGCYTSENYKLFSENNDLIVGKLA